MSDSLPRLRIRATPQSEAESLGPGEVASGLSELMPATLAISGHHWRLEIDDEPIESTYDRDELCWSWKPGFFAGEVRVRLLDTRSERAHVFRLDVSPSSEKLGREIFAELLTELRREQPEFVLGAEPALAPMGRLGRHDDPLLAYAKLRAHAEPLLDALARLLAAPMRRLRRERCMLPLEKIRRADRRTVMQFVREPTLAARLLGTEMATPPGRGPRLDAPIVEPHVDEPANRCVKALVVALIRRVIDCREQLTDRVRKEKQSDTRTGLEQRWPARKAFLDRLEHALRLALRGPVLTQVSRAELSAAGLTAIAAHPLYARAHRLGWWALGRGFEDGDQAQDLWLPPTFDLYERWCFVASRKLLREIGARETPNPSIKCELAWSGELADKTQIWLGFQVCCPSGSAKQGNAGFRSITRKRFPDFVLTITRGTERRWFVLDAKYRAGRSGVLDGMESAHVYHDSLRWHGRRADAAVIIIPAHCDAIAWMTAEGFRAEHGVGPIVARPGALMDLEAAFRAFLA
ncbi:DUF2357 domain-containing protein [Nannocystaceae bacterium ST9]